MVSLSLVLRYVTVLNFLILSNSKETFSSRLVRSQAKVLAEIGADDYPSTGRNTPVHDLGFPEFPSFQEAAAALPPPTPDQSLLPPPPTPDLPLLPPPATPDMPLLPPPSTPALPLLPPPAFPDPKKPKFPFPVWPSIPYYPPFPFIDHQAVPSVPLIPRFDEDSWMPSTPSYP